MAKRLFFIDGKYLGEAEAQAQFVHAELAEPISYGFFCETCGEVWARLPVPGRPWLPYRMPCAAHASRAFDMPAGSIAASWLPELLQACPEGVLRRELDLWWNYVQGTKGEKF